MPDYHVCKTCGRVRQPWCAYKHLDKRIFEWFALSQGALIKGNLSDVRPSKTTTMAVEATDDFGTFTIKLQAKKEVVAGRVYVTDDFVLEYTPFMG